MLTKNLPSGALSRADWGCSRSGELFGIGTSIVTVSMMAQDMKEWYGVLHKRTSSV